MPKMLATPVTYILIALCVICFIPVAADAFPDKVNPWALYFPDNPQFASWQYLTNMFMHGDTMHLLLNMFGLWMFGTRLEFYWGSTRYLLFYIACGIGGGLIYTWFNQYQFAELTQQFTQLGLGPAQLDRLVNEGVYPVINGLTEAIVTEFYLLYNASAVGASGALYGILAAYAFCFPNHKLIFIFIPFPIAAKFFVPIILMIDLFSGLTGFSIFGMNIAHFAHVGGALVGFLLAIMINQTFPRRQ